MRALMGAGEVTWGGAGVMVSVNIWDLLVVCVALWRRLVVLVGCTFWHCSQVTVWLLVSLT